MISNAEGHQRPLVVAFAKGSRSASWRHRQRGRDEAQDTIFSIKRFIGGKKADGTRR